MKTANSMRVLFSAAISLTLLIGSAQLDDASAILYMVLDFLTERLASMSVDLLNPDPRVEDSFRVLFQSIQGSLLRDNLLSLKYLLFTPLSPQKQHILQLTPKSLKESGFDSKLQTKIIIHGYTVKLLNTSIFFGIKDQLMLEGNYNVIVVNWTEYNGPPYISAFAYTYLVGLDIANLISFLMNNTHVSAQSFHLIGFSFGAQIAGITGKFTRQLGRISGLDAAGLVYQMLPKYLKLTDTDAIFVDAVHTNGELSDTKGSGYLKPFGDSDFFPNGGRTQPNCEEGDVYLDTDGKNVTVNSSETSISCSHDRATYLFLASIDNARCRFLSVHCPSYKEFNRGHCQSNTLAEMGFHAKPMPSLHEENTFFLNTSGQYPYCVPIEKQLGSIGM